MAKIRVLKFGGTSVGSPPAIRQILKIVQKPRGSRIAAVVVSAFSGVIQRGHALSAGIKQRVRSGAYVYI